MGVYGKRKSIGLSNGDEFEEVSEGIVVTLE